MITKFNKYNKLNEVLLFNKDDKDIELDNDTYIISYKKYIYILKDNDEDIESFLKVLNIDRFNWDWFQGTDIYELVEELKATLPGIIIFSINNKELYFSISGMYDYPIETTVSNQFIETLKVIKNDLGIDSIHLHSNIMDWEEERDSDEEYIIQNLIDDFTKDIKVKKMPKYIYHGTSTKALPGILKTGLRVGNTSNWSNIYKANKYLFLTSSLLDANFYARNSAEKTKSYPIIIKIDSSCIDNSKIDFDYDFYTSFVCAGNDYFDDLYNCSSFNGNIDDNKAKILVDLENKVVGATYRKFAYKGNIYPKYVESLFYNNDFKSEINNETDDLETFAEMIDIISDMYSWDDYYIYNDFDATIDEFNENNDEDDD